MGKKYYSYVVSVYRFMQICGLECDKKENVLLSHKIMMRKLSLRHSKMSDKCLLPRRACRENVKNDLIKTGAIVLVEDDYGEKLPYYTPRKDFTLPKVSKEELSRRRQEILSQLEEKEPCLSLGEKRYLERKKRKLLEEGKRRNPKESQLKLIKERE